MRKIFSLLFMLSLTVGLTSCYEDVISPGSDPNGPPQEVSFSGDLVPIFEKNCAMSGCHSADAKKPALTADKAFNALMAGGYVNTTVPDNSPIYTVVKPGGSMPSLNPNDLQKLLDWIRNGAPNN
ncbi:MAG: cytochrome c [Hymenobacteraceae bacterium]|nr:cytochrome c [Hymenobacteraceae bacterium]MDX5397034.1 cytochrome c [Hymenobacteraceae bacterium]MDX5442423.1 cytochrome c [Hymenobacteraceae bacterium]MDX5513106.1 cytochrome c [Hymenobacteraceae bacterium]